MDFALSGATGPRQELISKIPKTASSIDDDSLILASDLDARRVSAVPSELVRWHPTQISFNIRLRFVVLLKKPYQQVLESLFQNHGRQWRRQRSSNSPQFNLHGHSNNYRHESPGWGSKNFEPLSLRTRLANG